MTDDELNLLYSLFARQKQIEQVILYGSRAKGTNKPFSDVDITLLGIGLNRSHLNRLMADIDESSLPYLFDISLFDKLTNPDLIKQIEQTGVILYQREEKAFVAEPWQTKNLRKVPSQVSPALNSLTDKLPVWNFMPSQRFHKLHTNERLRRIWVISSNSMFYGA